MKTTHYELLGVDRESSLDELRQAWRSLSRQWHPDKHGGTQEATRHFMSLNEAYHTLIDKKARQVYNDSLDVLTNACTTCKGKGRTYKQQGFAGRIPVICSKCKGCGRVER